MIITLCTGEVDQMRRLQLSDDDRALMNKVKSQGEFKCESKMISSSNSLKMH